MIRGRTREICQRELDWLRTHRGATATLDPTDLMPPGWIARAIPAPPADDMEPGHE